MTSGQQAQNPRVDVIFVFALTFFVIGAFGGFFLTGIPRLTVANWPYLVGMRILWQLGGAVWCGVALADVIGASRWKSTILCTLLGVALCFNPLFDVIQSPLDIEGKVTAAQVWRGKIWRGFGASSNTIQATVVIDVEEGSSVQLKLRGRQANLWTDTFERCQDPGKTIQATVLQHLNVVLEANCKTD